MVRVAVYGAVRCWGCNTTSCPYRFARVHAHLSSDRRGTTCCGWSVERVTPRNSCHAIPDAHIVRRRYQGIQLIRRRDFPPLPRPWHYGECPESRDSSGSAAGGTRRRHRRDTLAGIRVVLATAQRFVAAAAAAIAGDIPHTAHEESGTDEGSARKGKVLPALHFALSDRI